MATARAIRRADRATVAADAHEQAAHFAERGQEELAAMSAAFAERMSTAGAGAGASAPMPRGQSRRGGPSGPVLGKRFAEIEPAETTWLWEGRLPLGQLTILYGASGLGKSTAVSDWVARVTTGADWPDGSPNIPGNVIMVCAEEDTSVSVHRRLTLCGADLTRVIDLTTVARDVQTPDDTPEGPFYLDRDRTLLEQAIRHYHASLVVLDPLMGCVSARRNMNFGQQAIRELLRGVQDMAARLGVAVLVVSHPTKGGKLNGSADIYNFVRSILKMIPDDSEPGAAILYAEKHSLCPNPPQLRVWLDADGRPTYKGGGTASYQKQQAARARSEGWNTLLAELRDHPDTAYNYSELAQITGIPGNTVASDLRRMRDQDHIVWQPRYGLWQYGSGPADPSVTPAAEPTPDGAPAS